MIQSAALADIGTPVFHGLVEKVVRDEMGIGVDT
jgi:hypothetical protein